jgi:hypothetical protein
MAAAVEAVFAFGQIARDVLVADRAIGADDRRLDVAERGVDPLEGRREDGFAARAGADRLVGAAGGGDAAEARQTIADDGAGGIQAALGEGFDLRAPAGLESVGLKTAPHKCVGCHADTRDRLRSEFPLPASSLRSALISFAGIGFPIRNPCPNSQCRFISSFITSLSSIPSATTCNPRL